MTGTAILVDSNVVSELMRASPARSVLDWFAAHDPSALFLSAVSEAELRAGAAFLPAGRRRDAVRHLAIFRRLSRRGR